MIFKKPKAAIGSDAKQSIQRLTKGGINRNVLDPAADFNPQAGSQRSTTDFPAQTSDNYLKTPLDMVITATVQRSIPVPQGATEVIVEDATAFDLIDEDGKVYTVQSVTWP